MENGFENSKIISLTEKEMMETGGIDPLSGYVAIAACLYYAGFAAHWAYDALT